MRRLALLAPLCLCLAWPAPRARAGAGIPARTVKEVKSATVFVKVPLGLPGGKRGFGTGSGFVMKVDGETGYVVTNHHVLFPPVSKVTREGPVTLVFWSGTRQERSVAAEIVATDPGHDLAVLRVKGFKDLPAPIPMDADVEVSETMTVYAFGFPFGQALSLTKGNPAMTVGKGSVSSIRENEFGQVARIQIDGDLNPGNSGGPVVDPKGRLIGVAVAKVKGTRIGMVIPAASLTKMLHGRVGGVGFTTLKVEEGAAYVRVQAHLIDPLGKIKAVALHHLRTPLAQKPAPDKEGRWAALPSVGKVDMKILGQGAVAGFKVNFKVRGRIPLVFQTSYVNGTGQTVYTQPQVHFLELGPEAKVVRRPLAKEPPVKVTGESVAAAKRSLMGLEVTELTLKADREPRHLCWSADGKAFFYLEPQGGVVRRVSFPGLREERVLEVGRRCAWLSVSARGLLVTLAEGEEVWLVEPVTLKVQAAYHIPGVARVESSPALAVAVAVTAREDAATTFDLTTGAPGQVYAGAGFAKRLVFGLAAVSPDGKYLFSRDAEGHLHRFKINGTALVHEQSGPRVAPGGVRIEISPDSKYVCLPTGGGNSRDVPDHPKVGPYATYVYAVTDLRKPAFVLEQGAHPRAVGFDPKAKQVYGQNLDKQLLVFGETGGRRREYALGPRGEETWQILVHPEGRRLLIRTDRKVYSVELTGP
jgi:S1-C subfamily serine protease